MWKYGRQHLTEIACANFRLALQSYLTARKNEVTSLIWPKGFQVGKSRGRISINSNNRAGQGRDKDPTTVLWYCRLLNQSNGCSSMDCGKWRNCRCWISKPRKPRNSAKTNLHYWHKWIKSLIPSEMMQKRQQYENKPWMSRRRKNNLATPPPSLSAASTQQSIPGNPTANAIRTARKRHCCKIGYFTYPICRYLTQNNAETGK